MMDKLSSRSLSRRIYYIKYERKRINEQLDILWNNINPSYRKIAINQNRLVEIDKMLTKYYNFIEEQKKNQKNQKWHET